VDSDPVALNSSFLNLPDGVSVAESEVEQAGSLYALLEAKGVPPMEANRTLEAIEANEEQATFLGVSVGSPLLLVEGMAYSLNHRPIEYHQVISVGGRYKYNVHLMR
jgi:GntR family transcriptional regulator